MGYKCFFMSDETYSASDVNQMFARLTSQGVSLFNVSGDGTLIDIDTAVSNFTGPGVELYNPDACRVMRVSDTQVKIMPGTAVMHDGSMIVFDDGGYTFTSADYRYVVLRRNVAVNTIEVLCITEDELEEDDISLAYIGYQNSVTDRRTFAATKLAPSTANIAVTKTIKIPTLYGGESYRYDMGWGGFQWIKCPQDEGSRIYDLSEGDGVIWTDVGRWYVSKQGNDLIFTVSPTTDVWGETVVIEVR